MKNNNYLYDIIIANAALRPLQAVIYFPTSPLSLLRIYLPKNIPNYVKS